MSKFGKYSFPFVENNFFRRLKAPKVFRLLFSIFKEYLFSVKTHITSYKEYLFSIKIYITSYKEFIYKSRVIFPLYLRRVYKTMLRINVLKYPIYSTITKFTALIDKIFSSKLSINIVKDKILSSGLFTPIIKDKVFFSKLSTTIVKDKIFSPELFTTIVKNKLFSSELSTTIIKDQVSSVIFNTRLFEMAEYTDFIFFSSEDNLTYDNGNLDFVNLIDYEDEANKFSYNNEGVRFITQNNDLGYKILVVPSGFLQPIKAEIAQKQDNIQDIFNIHTNITLNDVTYTFYISKTIIFIESGIRFIFGEFDDTPIKPVIKKINYT